MRPFLQHAALPVVATQVLASAAKTAHATPQVAQRAAPYVAPSMLIPSPPAAAIPLSNPAQIKQPNPCLVDGDLSCRARCDRCPNWIL